MRVAFVGQRQHHETAALGAPAGGLEPAFVEHRPGADPGPLLRALEHLRPEAVVVFGAEPLPLAGLDGVLRLGVVTGAPGADGTRYDRLVAADAALADGSVWRVVPLPVDDGLYDLAPAEPAHPARALFLGPSTRHRELWLTDVKHHFDVLHVAHGMHGDKLRELLGRTDVAITLHPSDDVGYEHGVSLHLAAGHLVLSEPLSPGHGLEPGLDYVEVTSPAVLRETMAGVHRHPALHHAIRRRGRRKAEQFRASRVWPRLLGDLARELGRGR